MSNQHFQVHIVVGGVGVSDANNKRRQNSKKVLTLCG